MNSSTPTSQPLRQSSSRLIVLQSFSKKASIAVTLIGGIVILGWIFDMALLKSVLPGLVSMKVNTALCFILGGVSLWLWHRQSATRIMRRVGLVCAILVLLIGLLTLIEYGFNLNFGIDQLLFKVSTIGVGEVAPGRMAVPSALNFLLLGLSLLLLSLGRRHYLPAQFFALFAFLIGFLGLLGYIYGNTYFYNVASFTSIAFHTTVAFLLLSLGILFARPDQGLMSIFISNHAGGLMARRLLPAAIALPPVLCWLILLGYNVKLYTAEMGICLLSILTIDIFAALIWWNARTLGAIDHRRRRTYEQLQNEINQRDREVRDRQQAEQALRESEFKFRAIFNQTFQLMALLNPEGTLLEANQTSLDFAGIQADDVIGRPFWEGSWWPTLEVQEQLQAAIAQAAAGDFVRYEVEHLGADKTVASIDFSLKPIKDETGRVVLLITEGRDITLRKKAEATVCQLNAQLEERVKERTAQLEETNQLLLGQKQVLEMLATGASLPDILDVLTRTLEAQSPEMLCTILVCDTDGQKLRRGASPSLPESYTQAIDEITIGFGVGSCGTAAYLGEPVIADDIASDPHWVNFRDLALSYGLRACWSQPILSNQSKVLGTFAAYYREPRRPRLKDLQLIETAAHIAGIAIEQKKVEQERSRLVAILEASPDYIGTTDPQGNSLWYNAQLKQVLGLNSDAEVAKRPVINNHPEWAVEVVQNQGLPTAIQDGIWVGETALRGNDGLEIPVAQMIIAHKSGDGSVEYFSTLMHDLSNRKRAQSALQESYSLLQTVIDSNSSPIFVKDLQGRYQLMNLPGASLFNKSVEEILGQDDTALFSPELAAKIQANDRKIIAAGKCETFEETIEIQGEWRTYLSTKNVYRDSQGNILGLVGFSRDITSLKQVQEALRQSNEDLEQRVQTRTAELVQANAALAESEERLRLFIEHAPSAIAMFDREMRYLVTSQRWLTDYDLDENIIGRSHYEVFPGLPERWEAIYQRCLAGAVEKNEDDCLLYADGTMDWLRWEVHPWRDRGEVGGLIMFTETITQRKQAEQKLKKAIAELARSNQELEQFAYVASHDLREPLRKIKSYTDLLVKRYQGQLDEKADKYIAYITDGAVRMQTLITDLLTYSRVGTEELPLKPTDLGAVLNRTLSDLSTAIRENNAIIQADPLPTVRANSTQMGQLLQNLIANAIKFRTLQPPQIQIKAALHDKCWTICVQDNGIGIEPQYSDRIFVIFQRLHTKEEYSGTGIGLSICKKIVERHGGKIWVESEPGQGTTFCFTLPAV